MRACAKIDLSALSHNIDIMRFHAGDSMLIPVIKADGYGHGALEIARFLMDRDYVWGFAVATYQEAAELRNGGVDSPIIMLSPGFPEDHLGIVRGGIRATVFTRDTARSLSDCAVFLSEHFEAYRGIRAHVHIKVDVGMSRIGILPDDGGLDLIEYIASLPGIDVEGIFTHFPCADEEELTSTGKALSLFEAFVDRLRDERGIDIPMIHCHNSAGGMREISVHNRIIRAGVTMYGLWPSAYMKSASGDELRPVMSLESTVVYVKSIPAGCSVGYGGTYTADSERIIATVPFGYADGYPRTLSNKGSVLIKGRRAPIVGRVCMDAMMVDVTDVPDVREGDRVVLLGCDGDEYITAEELGELSGRFNYELVCCISKRVPRVYI